MELEVESCNLDTMYKANASAMSLLTYLAHFRPLRLSQPRRL